MAGARLKRTTAPSPAGETPARLDKRLGLQRRGQEDGAGNLPDSATDGLSRAELDVLDALQGDRERIDARRNDIKAEIEGRLRALIAPSLDCGAPAAEARLLVRQTGGRLAHDWAAARAAADAARADLDVFRRTHDLRRGAVYPQSGVLQAGLLLVAAVFEALFSAALFAEEDARGLLGGAITAVGLSGANVTLGFLSGFLGLRHLQHVRLAVKWGGAIAFAFFALLAVLLNLFAADWRDRLAALTAPDSLGDAGFHLWSVLQLQSPQAIILLMLGAGVWVFASLKGYSGFDDPYPDYGKMDRTARDAAERLSIVRAAARRQLEAPVDAARAAISARLDAQRGAVEAMQKAFDAAAQRMEALNAQARALDDVASAAAQLYRQANLAARTKPPPAYFAQPLPSLGARADLLAAAASMIDTAHAQLQEARGDANAGLSQLLAELEETTARLDGAAAP